MPKREKGRKRGQRALKSDLQIDLPNKEIEKCGTEVWSSGEGPENSIQQLLAKTLKEQQMNYLLMALGRSWETGWLI